MQKLKVGVLTVSDRCYRGEAEDGSGENLFSLINSGALFGAEVVQRKIVPDDFEKIQVILKQWSDDLKLSVIFTTGGTGVAPRDITPEATMSVIDKEVPGMSLAMLKGSMNVTPMAMLSRAVCGVRGRTVIVNLPGSKKASQECLQFVAMALPHAVDLLQENSVEIARKHHTLQQENVHHHKCSHSFEEPSQATNPVTYSADQLGKVARRHRKSPYPTISVAEAQEMVLREATLKKVITVNYKDALGKVLASGITAKNDLPPFRASIKDGYAVIAADGAGVRSVIGDSTAGSQPKKHVLTPGHCIRINTGAPIPLEADAVVQVEDTELLKEDNEGLAELEIKILRAPQLGQDIRPIGSDIQAGQLLLESGIKLGPAELGLLASIGVTEVPVYSFPSVAVLSTGNELVGPEEELLPGYIRDSNKTTLLSLLLERGFRGVDLGIAKDEPEHVYGKLKTAFEVADVVVTTGGVSMGDKDYMKSVLQTKFGADILFGRVYMKPGLPTTFATVSINNKKKIVFGLPGNPVSATVTFTLFVLPALRKLAGFENPLYRTIKAQMSGDIHLDPRPEFHRAVMVWTPDQHLPVATSTGNQLSSRLLSMKSANALLVLPPKSETLPMLKNGSLVDAIIPAD